MKIDAAGMLLSDQQLEPIDLRYRCPDCLAPTWPGVDRHGKPRARRCVPCQVRHDRENGLL